MTLVTCDYLLHASPMLINIAKGEHAWHDRLRNGHTDEVHICDSLVYCYHAFFPTASRVAH